MFSHILLMELCHLKLAIIDESKMVSSRQIFT